MNSKLKYIIVASLLYGASGFNSAKAITADELLVAVQQFAGQVVQAFTQVGQALGDHEARINELNDDVNSINNPPVSMVVNCPAESIQQAINNVRYGLEVTIFIVGQCNESVSIIKDGITLSGNNDGDDTIDGGLTEVKINGAQRVQIEFLELTGAGYGVLVEEGAAATIIHSNIHDNVSDGIGAFNQAFVRVSFNTITGNGRPAPYYEAGIDASGGATVRSRGNLIADNGYAAVGASNMSYFHSGIFTAGELPDSADLDILLQKGCAQGQVPGSCGDAGTIALDCFRNGVCDLRNTDVTGTIEVGRASYLDARDSIINGNVEGFDGSRLNLRNTVSGSGLVSCSGETFASSGAIPCDGAIP